MRNTRDMATFQRRYQSAVGKGNPAMALHWHKKLTATYINAEWEVKQDLLCTVNKLEVHCDSLERSNNLLGWLAAGLFVLGTFYGHDILNAIISGYDYLYHWLCV